jgi:hypothetical protein
MYIFLLASFHDSNFVRTYHTYHAIPEQQPPIDQSYVTVYILD